MINDHGVVEMQHPEDEALYKELNALNLKKPSLKTTLTAGRLLFLLTGTRLLGGWDMDMAHYSTMVSTPTAANRQKFIQSAMIYVHKYGFDGMDSDCE